MVLYNGRLRVKLREVHGKTILYRHGSWHECNVLYFPRFISGHTHIVFDEDPVDVTVDDLINPDLIVVVDDHLLLAKLPRRA